MTNFPCSFFPVFGQRDKIAGSKPKISLLLFLRLLYKTNYMKNSREFEKIVVPNAWKFIIFPGLRSCWTPKGHEFFYKNQL